MVTDDGRGLSADFTAGWMRRPPVGEGVKIVFEEIYIVLNAGTGEESIRVGEKGRPGTLKR
jgi:hypothetical protein